MKGCHVGLALLMLVTGSINTLSVKWADTMKSESTDGKQRPFVHPFLQACGMFIGEMTCMVAFYLLRWYNNRKRRLAAEAQQRNNSIEEPLERAPPAEVSFSPFVFLPPALCDMTATSVQYIGLTLTYASSFQMLRGAVIIFTGVLSVLFLRRRLEWFRWLGILFIIGGLVTVGTTDIIYSGTSNSTDTNATVGLTKRPFNHEFFGRLGGAVSSDEHSPTEILIGDIMIVSAQVIVASQMVYEERFISKYNVHPLKAVGWEGTFGFLTLATLLIPMYFIHVGPAIAHNPRLVLEDAYDGLYQLTHNPQLASAFLMTMVSIAFFNFAGISVTKEMSATTRMVLDSVRTLVIWGVSLGIGWQVFHFLQLIGFFVLVVGMCIYNDLIIIPGIKRLCYRFGLLDRPGAYYDMQNEASYSDGEDEEDAVDGTRNGRRPQATNLYDPRHHDREESD